MRKLSYTTLLSAMFMVVGVTGDAGATVTFDLVWIATTGTGTTGTNTISAFLGDELTLGIRMTSDQTLGAHGISLNFDTDLGNELNLVGTGSWSGLTFGTSSMQTIYAQIGSFSPLSTVESTAAVVGRIRTYNGAVLSGPLFLPTGTYTIGTARFYVNSINPDGADVFSGLFNTSVDGVLNNANLVIPESNLVFHHAVVNVPEAGASILLGLGLVALSLARRRSSRS